MTLSQASVLVVDDEPQIRRALRLVLRANGYDVTEVGAGEPALDALASKAYDLMILDLVLPDVDGVEVCRRVREWSEMPVLILSAHGDEDIKVRALDEGADDFVTKPFSAPELMARMRRALRRATVAAARTQPVVTLGDVEIDLTRRRVLRDGREVHLTPTEYDLLKVLVQEAGRVLTHGHILRSVMGRGYEDANGTLRVHVASLRKKLEPDPSNPRIIKTEAGVGYRLDVD
jgi:two-component system, OmpR family, KDP operon response regulator KdpE